MSRSALLTGLSAALLSASFASAQALPLRFVTTDGTWDCTNEGAEPIGTLVLLETAYGFIGPDGKVVGYGKLHRVGEADYDLPHYIVLDGHLKDGLGYSGSTMRGPKEDYENYSKGIFFVLLKPDGTEAECVRRIVPGLPQ